MAREIPGCVVLQDGDDGINATFPVEALPLVAKRLGLFKKRVLSPEHLAKLSASNLQHRFNGSTIEKNEPEATIATQDDLGVEQP